MSIDLESIRDDAMSTTTARDDLGDVLAADVLETLQDLDQCDTQCRRRALIRATVAQIEATVYQVKHDVLVHGVGGNPKAFSAADIAMLREETYGIDHRGVASARTKFVPLDDNVRFTLRMILSTAPVGRAIDVGTPGWKSFTRCIKVRHRITHPRHVEDLDISDGELRAIKETHVWFIDTLVGCLSAARAQLAASDVLQVDDETRSGA
jgi:hypothetical protein